MTEFQQNQNKEEQPNKNQDEEKFPESDELTEIIEQAQQNNSNAQIELTKMHNLGSSVEKVFSKRIEQLEKAAEQGDVEAQFRLGDKYLEGIEVNGKVIIEPNFSGALKWLQKAAEQGHTEAKFYLKCIDDVCKIGVNRQELKELIEAKKYFLRLYGVKVENMGEFDNRFNQFIKEALKTGEYNIKQRFHELPFTKPITLEMIREIAKVNGYFYEFHVPDDLIFEDMDWSNSREVFKYLSFNEKTFSKISKGNFPKGYDPQEVFKLGKTIGLGIDEVHAMGFTGKGVGIAICDWQLKPHTDLKIKEYYCAEHASQLEDFFHASAVTGILAGKQTGVAPDSEVYFFAEKQDSSENNNNGGNDMIDSLQRIIEINKKLPDDKKIRVISISGPIYGDEEQTSALVKELTDSGVWVFSSKEFWKNFGYVEKKDPMGDPNDFNNYQINRSGSRSELNKNALYVNSGDRTVPYPSSETAYQHDSRASASWAIPVVAGYYALACQADPSMTPQRFIELAHKTAQVTESNWYEYEPNDLDGSRIPTGRSQETMPIQIIDIKALIDEIIKEKNG